MGGRYWVSGAQLGMIEGFIRAASSHSEDDYVEKQREYTVDSMISDIRKILEEVQEKQFIGTDETGDSMRVILVPK